MQKFRQSMIIVGIIILFFIAFLYIVYQRFFGSVESPIEFNQETLQE